MADDGPRRIVSLQPSITAILRDLGRLDLLVACTKYCFALCPELSGRVRAIVADSWTASASEIRALRPDLVIASVPYQEKSVIEILKTGVPVLTLSPKTLGDIYSDIGLISRIVGEADKGQAVIQGMQEQIEAMRGRTKRLPRRTVFCEEWGKPIIASQSWVAELVGAAGGEFIGTPGAAIEASEVQTSRPEVLIAAWCGAGDRVPLTKIVESRGWQDLPAVKAGRVYCIRDEFLNTPAPTLLNGLHALAAAIHPEHFSQPEGLRCISASPEPRESVGQSA